MKTFFSRKIDFSTSTGQRPINFTSPSIGAHTKNIRRILNARVMNKCSCA